MRACGLTASQLMRRANATWFCGSSADISCVSSFEVVGSRSVLLFFMLVFFFSSRRRHTRCLSDWSSDVCSSDLTPFELPLAIAGGIDGVQTQLEATRVGIGVFPKVAGDVWAARSSRTTLTPRLRSEERRVGKECRTRWSSDHEKKNTKRAKHYDR